MILPADIRAAVLTRWAAAVLPVVQAAYAAAGGTLQTEPNRRPGQLWYDKGEEFSEPPYGVFRVTQDGPARRVAYSDDYPARFKVTFAVYADQNLPPLPAAAARAAQDMTVWTAAALTAGLTRPGAVLYVGFGDAEEEFAPTLRNSNDVCTTRFALSLLCQGSTAAV